MPDIFVSPSTPAQPQSDPGSPIPRSSHTDRAINHAFSAFLYKPQGIRFETQEADEEIILFLRKHWITNFVWVTISLLLLLVPIFLFPLGMQIVTLPTNFPLVIINFIILVWYLLTFSYMLVEFLLWYFTVSIVTNERIIDVDFVSILNKKFAATRITEVEDVTLFTGGFIRTIFDYGDVIVQTAGTQIQFGFYAVPHPEEVVRIINNLMEQVKGERD